MKFDEHFAFYLEQIDEDWRNKLLKYGLPIATAATLGTTIGLHKLGQDRKLKNSSSQTTTNKSSDDDPIFLTPAAPAKIKQPTTTNTQIKPEETTENPIDDNLVNFILYYEYQPMLKMGDDKEFVLFRNKLDGNIELPGGVTKNGIEDAKRYGTLPKDFTLPEKMTKVDIKNFLKTKILPAYLKAVEQAVTVPLNTNQKKALISFAYNNGINGLKTMVSGTKEDPRLNQGNYKSISEQLPRWNKIVNYKDIVDPKTKKAEKIKTVSTSNGLTKRRASELKLFNS